MWQHIKELKGLKNSIKKHVLNKSLVERQFYLLLKVLKPDLDLPDWRNNRMKFSWFARLY